MRSRSITFGVYDVALDRASEKILTGNITGYWRIILGIPGYVKAADASRRLPSAARAGR
jgi:hypothetical protein